MARDRPDSPYEPTTWTKTVNGIPRERTATSISEEVRFRFDGWLPKPTAAAKKTTAPATSEPKSEK